MDAFKNISMDVRQLISISEKLHSSVLRGTALTPDETEIVRHCTTQLLGLTKITTRGTDNAEQMVRSSSNGSV